MSLYAINTLILFDSEAFTLYRADTPDEPLRIGAIASRCLDLLLESNGEIVGKRELMSGAWGAFGLEVTENSLAQVVRQLRVALEKLQPGHELILTVPRIGYRINERVELLDSAPLAAPEPPATEAQPQPPPAAPPAAHTERDWPSRLALAAAALACWTLLYKLPGLLYPIPLHERPFVEAGIEQLDDVTLHHEDMPAAALRPDNEKLAARARQLGQALDLGELHIYRFVGQDRSLNLLCSGELQPGNSHCLGLQIDE